LGGYDGYSVWLDLAGNYRIGLNIVRTGIIGVKGLVIEYGEYPVEYGEYSPTPSLKLLARFSGIWVKSSQVKSWGYAHSYSELSDPNVPLLRAVGYDGGPGG
jgi:hypothetical protein